MASALFWIVTGMLAALGLLVLALGGLALSLWLGARK